MMKDFRSWWLKQGSDGERADSRLSSHSALSARSTTLLSSFRASKMRASAASGDQSSLTESSLASAQSHRHQTSRPPSQSGSVLAANFSHAPASRARHRSLQPLNTGRAVSGSDSGVQMSDSASADLHTADDFAASSAASSMPGSARGQRGPRQHRSSASTTPRMVSLTGDSRADADILAFMKARQSLLEKGEDNVLE